MNRWDLVTHAPVHACVDAFVDAALELRAPEPLKPIAALVGSHLLRRQIQELLHRRTGGLWGVWLLTFHELAAKLGEPALLRDGREPASPLYQRALAARLLRGQAGHFAPIKDYDGAGAALLQTFSDLEEAGFARWPGKSASDDKLADLAALFNACRRELTAQRFSPQDALAAAAENARYFASAFGADALHVVGVYDANALQMTLLERLAQVVDVRFYLPEVFGEPTPLMRQLAGGQVSTPLSAKRRGVGGEVNQRDPPPTPPVSRGEGGPTILSCPSETAEAAEIVRRIRALRREGVAYHEMSVLLRQADPYADLLAEMAARAGVPIRIAGGQTPREAHSLRALARLLGLLGSPLGRGETMSLLSAVDLPPDATGRAWRETQPLWDRVSRRARVRKGEDWGLFLARFVARAEGPERQAAIHLREAALALKDGLSNLAHAESYRAATRVLADLVSRFIAADEHLEGALEEFDRVADADDAGLPFDLAFFRARALEIVAGVKKDETRDLADAVLVADWHAARGLRFRAAFLPGCVESQVPRPPRQDPILLDREREMLAAAAGAPGALPTRADQAQEEIRLFHLTCAAATERLFLTYPRLDLAKGRTRLPSHLLLELASRAVGHALTYDEFAASAVVEMIPAGRFAPSAPEMSLDPDERDLAAMAQAAGRDAIAPIHYLLGARPDEFGRVWRRQTARWAEPGVTAHDGWCETDEAIAALEKTLAEKDAWSVSEIEQFARCPRRYLFAELLGLESPEDPEAVVSLPADKRGSLLHKLLEETAGDPATPVDARVAEDYGALAEQNLTGGGALDQAERERLTAWAHAMLDFIERQSGGAEPVAVEEKFDAEIELGGMKVKLRLRPDRVERNADGALRIIDYKTGKAVGCFARDKGLRDNGFNGGSTLQLPLYLLAWLESHGWDASEKLSAAYWHLKDKKGAVDPTAVEFSVQFAREQLPKLRDALREIIEDVRRARFAPRPDVAAASGNAYCGNCPYRVICDGRGRAQLAAKAKRPGVRPCPWLDAIGRIDDE